MDVVQPSASCLPRTSGARRALHELLGSRTPRATKMLAQCLFHAKWLALPKSDGPWVIIEYAGSGALCGRICYSHAYDSIDSLLNRLAPRLLGCLGETFVAYDLCKKPMPDQPADELYEALAPTTCLSSIAKDDPLCLLLVVKPNPTNEEKVRVIDEALRQATTDEQLLRILEIIGQINSQSLRRNTLRDNIQHFLTRQYLKIAEQITNIAWRDRVLDTIGDYFLGKNDPEKAIEIALLITDFDYQDQALRRITRKLIKRNDPEKAIEVALLITDPGYQEQVLRCITRKLIERNDLENALEATQQRTYSWWKDLDLKDIALKLIERNDTKKALEVAQPMTDVRQKDKVLRTLALKLVERNDLEKAIEVAIQIDDVWQKDNALKDIALKLIKRNDPEKAIEVALLITDLGYQEQILRYITRKLIKRNDLENALEATQQITDDWWKDLDLKDIALKLIERNDPEKALEVANLITKPKVRSSAMWNIRKPYIMNAISKIVKVVCFAILSLITYKLITSIRNASLLQRLSAKTKA